MIGSQDALVSIASCIKHPCPQPSMRIPYADGVIGTRENCQIMRSSMYIGIERIYSLAARVAVSAFIQDPLTLDLVINAPALTSHGVAIARDRLRHLSIKRTSDGLRSK